MSSTRTRERCTTSTEQLPVASSGSGPRRFRVDVPQEVLERIRQRVASYRWDALPEAPGAGDWRYGPPIAFLRDLCAYWVDQYDWRAQERVMNAVPHFLAEVDGVDLHLVHEHGSGPSPMPLLIAHGWPYSFHSYSDLVDRLAHPERHGGRADEAFDVIIPSYPGYGGSARAHTPCCTPPSPPSSPTPWQTAPWVLPPGSSRPSMPGRTCAKQRSKISTRPTSS